jgi:hypothetical protein
VPTNLTQLPSDLEVLLATSPGGENLRADPSGALEVPARSGFVVAVR